MSSRAFQGWVDGSHLPSVVFRDLLSTGNLKVIIKMTKVRVFKKKKCHCILQVPNTISDKICFSIGRNASYMGHWLSVALATVQSACFLLGFFSPFLFFPFFYPLFFSVLLFFFLNRPHDVLSYPSSWPIPCLQQEFNFLFCSCVWETT